MNGPGDWAAINKTIPLSCCQLQAEKCEKADFNDGCLPKLVTSIKQGKTKLIWIVAAIIVFEVCIYLKIIP